MSVNENGPMLYLIKKNQIVLGRENWILSCLKSWKHLQIKKITYKINIAYLPMLEIWITVKEWEKSTLDSGCKEKAIQDSSSSAGEEG